MSLHPSPPVSSLLFTGLDAIAAGATTTSTNKAAILGYNEFALYCKGDQDFIVYIDVSEDHSTWYRLRSKDWSDVLSEHSNGSVDTVAVTITPSDMLQSSLIHNTHTSQTLSASFDGGTTYTTIDPDQSLSIHDNSYSFMVKGSAAATTYEILNVYYLWGKIMKANSNAVFKFDAQSPRYLRVQVENLGATALDADITLKVMDG